MCSLLQPAQHRPEVVVGIEVGHRHRLFQPQAQPLGGLADGTGFPRLPQAHLGNAVALVAQVDQGQLTGTEVGMDQDHPPPLGQGLA